MKNYWKPLGSVPFLQHSHIWLSWFGAFGGKFCRRLHFIHHIFPSGTLTAVWYIDGILPQYAVTFLACMDPDSVFMEDDIRIHRIDIVGKQLDSEVSHEMAIMITWLGSESLWRCVRYAWKEFRFTSWLFPVSRTF